jgi:hypothetical protein
MPQKKLNVINKKIHNHIENNPLMFFEFYYFILE